LLQFNRIHSQVAFSKENQTFLCMLAKRLNILTFQSSNLQTCQNLPDENESKNVVNSGVTLSEYKFMVTQKKTFFGKIW
jgi:hypothetical protein